MVLLKWRHGCQGYPTLLLYTDSKPACATPRRNNARTCLTSCCYAYLKRYWPAGRWECRSKQNFRSLQNSTASRRILRKLVLGVVRNMAFPTLSFENDPRVPTEFPRSPKTQTQKTRAALLHQTRKHKKRNKPVELSLSDCLPYSLSLHWLISLFLRPPQFVSSIRQVTKMIMFKSSTMMITNAWVIFALVGLSRLSTYHAYQPLSPIRRSWSPSVSSSSSSWNKKQSITRYGGVPSFSSRKNVFRSSPLQQSSFSTTTTTTSREETQQEGVKEEL